MSSKAEKSVRIPWERNGARAAKDAYTETGRCPRMRAVKKRRPRFLARPPETDSWRWRLVQVFLKRVPMPLSPFAFRQRVSSPGTGLKGDALPVRVLVCPGRSGTCLGIFGIEAVIFVQTGNRLKPEKEETLWQKRKGLMCFAGGGRVSGNGSAGPAGKPGPDPHSDRTGLLGLQHGPRRRSDRIVRI